MCIIGYVRGCVREGVLGGVLECVEGVVIERVLGGGGAPREVSGALTIQMLFHPSMKN